MIFALASLALAHDVSPALFVPSTSPGEPEGEVQSGIAYRARSGDEIGGTHITTTVRLDRLAFGVSAGVGPSWPYVGSGWVGVALVDTRHVRLQAFGEVGGFLRPGMSFAARTARGGIGGHGYLFDLAWGPAWSVDRLVNDSWGEPFDVRMSYPEGGVSMALHPAGTQFLRLGFVGPSAAVSYRLDLRNARRGGFVLESALGVGPTDTLVTLSMGWSRGPRGR